MRVLKHARRWRGRTGAGRGQRCADSPSCGNGNAGLDGNLLHWNVCGIHHQPLPLQARHLFRNATVRNGVQVSVHVGHARRHLQVELIEVYIITAPGQCLAVGRKDDADDLRNGPVWRMIARNPLWRDERHRPRLHRKVNLRVEEPARRLREIRGDLDGRLLREGSGSRRVEASRNFPG